MMEKRTIESTILSLINEELDIDYNLNVELVSKLESAGIDSIAMMTLWVLLEETFHFTVDEDVLISTRFITVNDIAEYVDEKINHDKS
jgi:acyl carrier protein